MAEIIFSTSEAAAAANFGPANGRRVVFTSNGTANTEDTVAHGLTDAAGNPRAPVGYFVMRKDKAGVVYDSGTAFDATNLFLKTSVATVAVTLWVF